MVKHLISVIVPVYNEDKNIARAYSAIVEEFKKHPTLDYEIIFTDNASSDNSFEMLRELANKDQRVRVLRFVRNFGFQHSILTGYRYAKGDAAIQLDCDLEDPPAIFSEFIRLWHQGHDVVIGIRSKRIESRSMIILRRFYYKFLDRISDISHKVDAGDFRLIDRSILNQLHHIHDAQPYVRGLISELARKQASVHYQRNKREFNHSKFPLRQLMKLASDGVYASSTFPLRVATYVGIGISFITLIMIVMYAILRVFSRNIPEGFTTTTILILFGISLNALFLGIIGEYMARLYNQLRSRPLVVIAEKLNIND